MAILLESLVENIYVVFQAVDGIVLVTFSEPVCLSYQRIGRNVRYDRVHFVRDDVSKIDEVTNFGCFCFIDQTELVQDGPWFAVGIAVQASWFERV